MLCCALGISVELQFLVIFLLSVSFFEIKVAETTGFSETATGFQSELQGEKGFFRSNLEPAICAKVSASDVWRLEYLFHVAVLPSFVFVRWISVGEWLGCNAAAEESFLEEEEDLIRFFRSWALYQLTFLRPALFLGRAGLIRPV